MLGSQEIIPCQCALVSCDSCLIFCDNIWIIFLISLMSMFPIIVNGEMKEKGVGTFSWSIVS